jgi:MscS family membrane protein
MYELGYNLNGLATGLGVGAAVISLAAQDLVKSLLGGMAILTDKPFIIGDWIECGKYQGTVIDITYRSTRIKAANNSIITIPNSIVTAEYVLNWNKLTSRRIDLNLNLSLDTPSEKLDKITKQIEFALQNDKDVLKDTVEVHVSEISTNGINVLIFLYEKVTDYYKFLDVKQRLICTILAVLEKENVELAYPGQSIVIKQQEKNVIV